MKKVLLFFILIPCALITQAQRYHIDSIPDFLKKRADAVVRSHQCVFNVLKPGEAVRKVKMAVTLLDEDALYFRRLSVYYNNFSRISYITGTVYDEKGKKIRSIAADEILDISAVSGGTFYSDDRIKTIYFPLYKLPYTIEYEYSIKYSSMMGFPEWVFQVAEDVAVEYSAIQYIVPQGMQIRFRELSLKNKADSIVQDGKTVYTWREENIPARATLPQIARYASPPPLLYAAADEFEYGGYRGSMKTWEDFGRWAYAVNKDRDNLPADESAFVQSLAGRFTDKTEKVKALYKYMQSRTRYVNISLGIGGYQTAEASLVSKNGFGDCKALTNYTKALLKAAGIESFFALVMAGRNVPDINVDFVSAQFNHVILCVPVTTTDTVWLECTDQNIPFNYLGNFTSDRHVLLLTPAGGKLARTPDFKKYDNTFSLSGTISLTEKVSSATIEETYSGYYFDRSFEQMFLQTEDELKKTLYKSLDFPAFTVNTASYNLQNDENPSATLNYQINIEGLGYVKNNNMYLNSDISGRELLSGFPVNLKIPVNTVLYDSIVYRLPFGYSIETLPDNVLGNNEYGTFSVSYIPSANQVTFFRVLKLTKGVIPVTKYPEFREFYNSFILAGRQIVVLKKSAP
ncbi:MAG: DUF3857 domain-containing protein [Bacteroidales bacterium]|nr:DUF3857 domain-containing protein [Bacteroidales bacterium]